MHDSFDEPDFYAIILDLAVGGDILDRVMRRHSYSELDARTSMNALLSAVAHCHSHKIAHRDIKPDFYRIMMKLRSNYRILAFLFEQKMIIVF